MDAPALLGFKSMKANEFLWTKLALAVEGMEIIYGDRISLIGIICTRGASLYSF